MENVRNDTPESSDGFRELCRLAGRAIGRYRMIEAGDRIMIGVSGGKDSLMLTHVLHQLRRRSPVKFELVPAVFDPGFPDFGLEKLREYCARQGWALAETALPVAEILREKGDKNPCMLCSRLRRGKLYGLAAELGCNRLALGQHFDDAATSFLISLLRGQGLKTMGPNVAAQEEDIRIIRPLIFAPEPLIVAAAAKFDFPNTGKCAYATRLESDGDRAYFKRLLADVEKRIPHWRSQMLQSLSNVRTEYLLDDRFCLENENSAGGHPRSPAQPAAGGSTTRRPAIKSGSTALIVTSEQPMKSK